MVVVEDVVAAAGIPNTEGGAEPPNTVPAAVLPVAATEEPGARSELMSEGVELVVVKTPPNTVEAAVLVAVVGAGG